MKYKNFSKKAAMKFLHLRKESGKKYRPQVKILFYFFIHNISRKAFKRVLFRIAVSASQFQFLAFFIN